MQVDLFDMAEFIKVNKLEEISDPMLFVRGGVPSSTGLLSTDIFGVSINDRKTTYAYIDLHDYFIHPFVYKLLLRLNRNFSHIVHGTKKYVIDKGLLVEDEESGETGIRFLYDNWEKINFDKNNSLIRNERIDLLNAYKKNVIFTKYWLVIPAFYRDVNLQNIEKGKLSHHEINDKYSKLIRLASLLSNSNSFEFTLISTKAKIQNTLVEIYDLLKGKLEKKQGLIRKNLLGKSVDYGARAVISAPTFHTNKWDEMDIDLYHVGIPLSQCCSLFTPFIVSWVKGFFRREFEKSGNKYLVKDGDKLVFVELDNPELYFNDEYIKKQIDQFIFSYTDRFVPIELPIKSKEITSPVYLRFAGRVYDDKDPTTGSSLDRNATWCDILYQAAVDVCSDKMVYVTRYPITDYFSTFPSQITVLSTTETVPVFINGTVYKHYPYIDLSKSKDAISTSFHDTVTMSNLMLKGLGGDYDGDQISIRGLFTQEANEEARRLMKDKSFILNIQGENMRVTSNEGIQTLWMLTKFENQ